MMSLRQERTLSPFAQCLLSTVCLVALMTAVVCVDNDTGYKSKDAGYVSKDKGDVPSSVSHEARNVALDPPSMTSHCMYCGRAEEGGVRTFDISLTVKTGVRAQLEYCDDYCNGTHKLELRGPSCRFLEPFCKECFCDEACKYYGDCCPQVGVQTLPQIGDESSEVCTRIPFASGPDVVRVISSCSLSSTNPDLEKDCLRCGNETSANFPIFSLNTLAIYCNKACALCNGEVDVTFTINRSCLDTVKVDIREKSTIHRNGSTSKNITKNSFAADSLGGKVGTYNSPASNPLPLSCQSTFIPNLSWLQRRRCHSNGDMKKIVVSSCNATVTSERADGDAMERLCHGYSYHVFAGDAVYRNLFCALCNGLEPSRPRDGPPMVTYNNVLTSLRPMYTYKTVGPRHCQQGQWYDFAQDECRPVQCEKDRVWAAGQPYCAFPPNSTTNETTSVYQFTAVFKSLETFACVYRYRNHNCSLFRNIAKKRIVQALQLLNSGAYAIYIDFYLEKCQQLEANVKFIAPNDGSNQTAVELGIAEHFIVSKLLLKVDDSSSERMVFQVDITTQFRSMSSKPLVSFRNGSCCFTADEDFDISKYASEKSPQNIAVVTFTRFSMYALVFLNESEYETGSDASIQLSYVNATVDSGNFYSDFSGVYVPILYLQQAYNAAGLSKGATRQVKVRVELSDPAEGIVRSCCLGVSVLSLLFLLATYGTFPELRTLPGINNVFLGSWLLMAQVLLLVVTLVEEYLPLVCLVLGVSLHLSWLCVVSWSSMCSFHMFHVFVLQQNRMQAPHRESWYLKRYILIAHALPASIVVAVVVVSSVLSDGKDIGYGGHVCYLNTVLLRGVAFMLPLALSVVFNVIQLVLTMRAFANVDEVQSCNPGQPKPSYVSIYTRLSSLTGLCWIVALVADVPGCRWLSYVSAVLNGLQGLHLAYSYVCNKRVAKLWREKLQKRGDSDQRTSTVSFPHQNTNKTNTSSV